MRSKIAVAGLAAVAVFVCVAAVAVSVRMAGLRGPGQITFGTALVGGRLVGRGTVFEPKDRTLILRANLVDPGQIEFDEVTELFHVRKAGGWSNVAWITARANPASSTLVTMYPRRYLTAQGVKAPGLYRVLVLGPIGFHQAVGTFRLAG